MRARRGSPPPKAAKAAVTRLAVFAAFSSVLEKGMATDDRFVTMDVRLPSHMAEAIAGLTDDERESLVRGALQAAHDAVVPPGRPAPPAPFAAALAAASRCLSSGRAFCDLARRLGGSEMPGDAACVEAVSLLLGAVLAGGRDIFPALKALGSVAERAEVGLPADEERGMPPSVLAGVTAHMTALRLAEYTLSLAWRVAVPDAHARASSSGLPRRCPRWDLLDAALVGRMLPGARGRLLRLLPEERWQGVEAACQREAFRVQAALAAPAPPPGGTRPGRGEAGEWSFGVGEFTFRGGGPYQLAGNGLKLLKCLAGAAGEARSEDDIRREVWGDEPQEGHTLRQAVYQLRKDLRRLLGLGGEDNPISRADAGCYRLSVPRR